MASLGHNELIDVLKLVTISIAALDLNCIQPTLSWQERDKSGDYLCLALWLAMIQSPPSVSSVN